VYALSFSLILLHTDAHNKNVKHKMTREQFISQIRSLDNGDSIANEVLYILYDNVTNLEFFQDNLTNRPSTGGSSNKNAKWMKWSETGYDSSSTKASFNTVQQVKIFKNIIELILTVLNRWILL
jgi:Sec7-like guanine-nucleotide exchange factor